MINGAFSGTAAAGGFVGAALKQAIRYGVARGIFSNESGLGSAGIAAAAAQTREPVRQAGWWWPPGGPSAFGPWCPLPPVV